MISGTGKFDMKNFLFDDTTIILTSPDTCLVGFKKVSKLIPRYTPISYC